MVNAASAAGQGEAGAAHRAYSAEDMGKPNWPLDFCSFGRDERRANGVAKNVREAEGWRLIRLKMPFDKFARMQTGCYAGQPPG
jgi:hypothetical protein